MVNSEAREMHYNQVSVAEAFRGEHRLLLGLLGIRTVALLTTLLVGFLAPAGCCFSLPSEMPSFLALSVFGYLGCTFQTSKSSSFPSFTRPVFRSVSLIFCVSSRLAALWHSYSCKGFALSSA
jgi:hypothetical protein